MHLCDVLQDEVASVSSRSQGPESEAGDPADDAQGMVYLFCSAIPSQKLLEYTMVLLLRLFFWETMFLKTAIYVNMF